MTSDESLIATLAVGLVLAAVWFVYRPYLTAILFDSPPKQPTSGNGMEGPTSLNPFKNPLIKPLLKPFGLGYQPSQHTGLVA
ncbi:MAG: hypothetical protein ACREHG_03750 [Candidatus Saccharimonadales bacterium]